MCKVIGAMLAASRLHQKHVGTTAASNGGPVGLFLSEVEVGIPCPRTLQGRRGSDVIDIIAEGKWRGFRGCLGIGGERERGTVCGHWSVRERNGDGEEGGIVPENGTSAAEIPYICM